MASGYRAYEDPDAFAEGVQNAHLRVMPALAGHFSAHVTLVRLPVVNLSQAEESLPRRALIETSPGRIYFRPTLLDDPPRSIDGEDELPGTLRIRQNKGISIEQTKTASVLRALSLPYEALQARAAVLLGRDLAALLRGGSRWCPAPAHFAALVALHRDAIRLARHAPGSLDHPVAAAALDARIGEALLAAWGDATAFPDRAAQRRGDLLMTRALRFIEDQPATPISLTALCAAAGCSAKTLETLFRERSGQTPNRYLRTRRLWMTRRMLLTADPGHAKVGDVAFQCGFWELGRFAGAYRAMFGELPSATLLSKRHLGGLSARLTNPA